mgnify:CR=1 FL=1
MTKSDPAARMSRTVTRADLSEAVYQRVGLSRAESAHLVEAFLHEISDTIARGETVKRSSFGSFVVRSSTFPSMSCDSGRRGFPRSAP